eukprot:NODE_101_length_3284_cov_28.402164_g91_i0.p1 GENE.NODE_101_length_3284_cov_28.402164_g91_i0~~NODE_101_length_3284_cov_28.402164_g91_i0.p1  ORF type:complete len:997 (+),score=205.01 NODE_101_length_3284_cov_28.402164_g91_i0:125-3115(+)
MSFFSRIKLPGKVEKKESKCDRRSRLQGESSIPSHSEGVLLFHREAPKIRLPRRASAADRAAEEMQAKKARRLSRKAAIEEKSNAKDEPKEPKKSKKKRNRGGGRNDDEDDDDEGEDKATGNKMKSVWSMLEDDEGEDDFDDDDDDDDDNSAGNPALNRVQKKVKKEKKPKKEVSGGTSKAKKLAEYSTNATSSRKRKELATSTSVVKRELLEAVLQEKKKLEPTPPPAPEVPQKRKEPEPAPVKRVAKTQTSRLERIAQTLAQTGKVPRELSKRKLRQRAEREREKERLKNPAAHDPGAQADEPLSKRARNSTTIASNTREGSSSKGTKTARDRSAAGQLNESSSTKQLNMVKQVPLVNVERLTFREKQKLLEEELSRSQQVASVLSLGIDMEICEPKQHIDPDPIDLEDLEEEVSLGENAIAQRQIRYQPLPRTMARADLLVQLRGIGVVGIDHIHIKNKGGGRRFAVTTFETPALARDAMDAPPLKIGRGEIGRKYMGTSENQRRARVLLQHAKQRRENLGIRHDSLLDRLGTTMPLPKWDLVSLAENPVTKNLLGGVLDENREFSQSPAAYAAAHNVRIELNEKPVDPLPIPVGAWTDVTFGSGIDAVMREAYAKPTVIQSLSWPVLLAGNDCVGLSETGSGKTLAYLLPSLVHLKCQPVTQHPRVLVLAPTRELVLQLYREYQRFSAVAKFRLAISYGGAGGSSHPAIQGSLLLKGCDVLVAAPGRLPEFIEAGILVLHDVSYLVLDEVDQLLVKPLDQAVSIVVTQTRPDRQTALFSATFMPRVRERALQLLSRPVWVVVNDADKVRVAVNVTQNVVVCRSTDKRMMAIELVQKVRAQNAFSDEGCRILIFVPTFHEVELVSSDLKMFRLLPYRGLTSNMQQKKRIENLTFMRNNESAILVSTGLAGRGIDIPNIKCVISLDAPTETIELVHRLGRTGRAGKTGLSYAMFDPDEDSPQRAAQLVELMETANQGDRVPQELREIAARWSEC